MAKRYAASSRQHIPATAVVTAPKPVAGSFSKSHSSSVLPPPPPAAAAPPASAPPPPAAAATAAPPADAAAELLPPPAAGSSTVRVASSLRSVAYSCVSSRSMRSRMISSLAEAESSVLLGPAGQADRWGAGAGHACRWADKRGPGHIRPEEKAAHPCAEKSSGRQARQAGQLTRGCLQAAPCAGQPGVHVGHQHRQRGQHPGAQVAVCSGRQAMEAGQAQQQDESRKLCTTQSQTKKQMARGTLAAAGEALQTPAGAW
jgi:hypothetical protein